MFWRQVVASKQDKEEAASSAQKFANEQGSFDLEVTTFQMSVLFAWNERPRDRISFGCLRLATELPDPELRRTLLVGEA